MTGKSKTLCGGGKGWSSSLPVTGRRCGTRQWNLRTGARLGLTRGNGGLGWREDVRNLSGVGRQFSKFLKRGTHRGLVMELLVWEIHWAAGARSTACSLGPSALPRALAVGPCPSEDEEVGGLRSGLFLY